MDNLNAPEKKKAIVAATWEYLLKTGLGNASVGELCRETKLSQSSLYYWFENKDDIWISAGKYGLSKVVDALLDFTLKNAGDVGKYFDTLLQEIDKYKSELRCAIQITVSPVYGERMRDTMMSFNAFYAVFAKQLMGIFDCTFDQAELFIYSTLSAIVDYAVWDDGEKTQIVLESIKDRTQKIIAAGKGRT